MNQEQYNKIIDSIKFRFGSDSLREELISLIPLPAETTNEKPNVIIEYFKEHYDYVSSTICANINLLEDHRDQAFKYFKDKNIKINGILEVRLIV